MLTTYSSTQTSGVVQCAIGTGAQNVGVLAESVISEADAADKALGSARLKAVRTLECAPSPSSVLTVYSVQKTANRMCFQCGDTATPTLVQVVTVPAGAFYMDHSPGNEGAAQAAVDAAAQAKANALAADKTPCPTRYLGFTFRETAWCGGAPLGYEMVGSYLASEGLACSMVSQNAANQQAMDIAGSRLASQAVSCVPVYGNDPISYTATCPKAGDPTKIYGTPVTVHVPANTPAYNASSKSLSNLAALTAATAAALAQLNCYLYVNEPQQPVAKTCEDLFGGGWGPLPGGQPSVSDFAVQAGVYSSSVSTAAANAAALAAAQAAYEAAFNCIYGGSGSELP